MIRRADENLEEQLLAMLLRSPVHIEQAIQIVTPQYFHNPTYKRIFSLICKVFTKYHTVVDKQMFDRGIEKTVEKEEERIRIRTLFSSLIDLEVDTGKFSFVVEELQGMQIARSLHDLVVVVADKLNHTEGDPKELLSDAEQRIQLAKTSSSLSIVNRGFISETVEKRKADYFERKEKGDVAAIPFGIKKLDEVTGGHYPGELSLWFARTGRGKSTILHNIAYNCFTAKKRGLVITIEMSREQVERKFDARQARVNSALIKRGKLDPEDESKWLKVLELQKDSLVYVADIPRGCDVGAVEAEIDLYEKKNGKLSFVLVDYLNLMTTSERFSNSADKYGNITRGLKELARVKRVSMMSAAQMVRPGNEKVDVADVGTEHIALSDQIGHHCDFIGYLDQGKEDILKNQIQQVVIKFRDGANIRMTHFCDFSRTYIGDEIWQLPRLEVTGKKT